MIKIYYSFKRTFHKCRSFILLFLIVNSVAATAQNVGINSSGNTPDASAGLDIDFDSKGLLIPRVNLTSTLDVITISSPATSLLVYNTATAGAAPNNVSPGFYYYDGGKWTKLTTANTSTPWATSGSNISYTGGNVGIGSGTPAYKLHVASTSNPLFLSGLQTGTNTDSVLTINAGVVKKVLQSGLGGGGNGWSITGNGGTTYTNFIGTTAKQSLRFKTDNNQRMIIDSLGNVAIGTTTSSNTLVPEKVTIDAGVNNSTADKSGLTGLMVKGTSSKFFQFNIQNKSSSSNASTDIVATANDGNDENYYVNLGINGSAYDPTEFGTRHDSYLRNMGGDLYIGTGTPSKNIRFLTGGGAAINERMMVSSSGNIGIATINPLYKLHIKAASNPLYMTGLQLGTATDSLLTVTAHLIKKIPNTNWIMGGNNVAAETKFGTISAQALPFITSNTEKMRLSTLGTLSINSTNPDETYKLFVNGNAQATAWNTTSDGRLKTNIKDLNYGLNSILALRPVSYNWTDKTQSQATQIGLIAQEAKTIVPEIVSGDEEKGKLSINYTELIPVLINAMKEQQSKIDAQQKQIDELKKLINKN